LKLKPAFKKLVVRSLKLLPETMYKQIFRSYYFSKLKAYGERDQWECKEADLQIVKHLVLSGDDVIDVGANFGFYTAFLAKLVGAHGYVYSFEPIPLTFEVLSYNTKKLPLTNVHLFNYAVSHNDDWAIMEIPKWESGNENYFQARIPLSNESDRSLQQVKVFSRTLDSVFRDHGKRIAFIKIDVEGHELQVIEGAKCTIAKYKPALLIEISGDLDANCSSSSMLANYLQAQGYCIYWYDGTMLRRRSFGDRSINYFFLTQDQFEEIEHTRSDKQGSYSETVTR
jgi:FkbM family methyltransferase